jgi:hypothetical protein
MNQSPEQILKQIQQINQKVKQKLTNKGLVPARISEDGVIRVGSYSIVRHSTGFYSVLDRLDRPMADSINLPQTAALIANKLALGQWTDQDLITLDRKYGYYEFDETLHKRNYIRCQKQKNYERAELMNEKYLTAKQRKEVYQQQIQQGFDKLIKIA